MAPDAYVFDELDEESCRRLLEVAPIGRVGFTRGALPQVRPVHFAVRGDEVVIGLGRDSAASASPGHVVAFEVDSYNPPTGEGWGVSVIGRARLITDIGEIEELDALGFAPWKADQGSRYFAIAMDVIQGRRLCRHRGAVLVE